MTAITTRTETRTTYSAEAELRTTPMQPDTGRGLYYMPQGDDRAADEARGKVEPLIAAIREKMKDPEAAVHWHVDQRDGKLFVMASATAVRRS